MSHPTRVRGLKYDLILFQASVAPHTGVWIEIITTPSLVKTSIVAPHTGAWIEIKSNMV